MKKNYQKPYIEITSIAPLQLIAASLKDIKGMSGDSTILIYGGGSTTAARAGGSNLWDEEDASDWDDL